MLENEEDLIASQEQLAKLRAWEDEAVNDLNLHPRLKKSELAGIQSMIAQIEKEIRLYNLARLRETLQELQLRSRTTPPEKLPELFAQTLGAMEEFTIAIQPVV
ncbi:MAG: hypothetical protein ACREOI_05320 [bacterium]